ncbi:hypothetical protein YC2023_033497 [Brassica napus]
MFFSQHSRGGSADIFDLKKVCVLRDDDARVSSPLLKRISIQIVKRLHNEWVENADRWVAGFLEIFEDGFIRREVNHKIPRNKLENGEDDDADDQFYEEYFDHDLGRDEDEDERQTINSMKNILTMTWAGMRMKMRRSIL